jgi:histone H3/H4
MDTDADDFADCGPAHPATMGKNVPEKGFVAPAQRQRKTTAVQGGLRANKARALGILQNAQRRKGLAPVRKGGKVVAAVAAKIAEEEVVKKRKSRPATIAERKVYKEQKNTGLLFPKLPVTRIVREIAQEYSRVDREGNYFDFRFSKQAMATLHEGAEDFLTHFMARLNKLADHSGRCTVFPDDVRTLESLDKMHSGGVLERTVYHKTNSDGSTGKCVLIGATPKKESGIK